MYYVYVIKSLRTGNYYKGLTNNLARRLNEHISGKSKFRKSEQLLTLVHVEICQSRLEARKVEKYLKSGYGREIIKEIDAGVVKWYTRRT